MNRAWERRTRRAAPYPNLANLLTIKAEEKGLEPIFDLPPDLPTALVGDALGLGQVLVNLVSNAVKSTERVEIIIGAEQISRSEQTWSCTFGFISARFLN